MPQHGGPFDLGASCEAIGNCTFVVRHGDTITHTGNQFLGILIGARGEHALKAHLAHGDGWATQTYNPPLHLAPLIGPHQASNVECLANRLVPQPDEPGNQAAARRAAAATTRIPIPCECAAAA